MTNRLITERPATVRTETEAAGASGGGAKYSRWPPSRAGRRRDPRRVVADCPAQAPPGRRRRDLPGRATPVPRGTHAAAEGGAVVPATNAPASRPVGWFRRSNGAVPPDAPTVAPPEALTPGAATASPSQGGSPDGPVLPTAAPGRAPTGATQMYRCAGRGSRLPTFSHDENNKRFYRRGRRVTQREKQQLRTAEYRITNIQCRRRSFPMKELSKFDIRYSIFCGSSGITLP